jgi:hypothetical protein
MKLREHIAVALSVLPTLAGCVGVIGGGYMALCTAPMWIDTVSELAADAVCASVCGIGAGMVLVVCVILGGRQKRKASRADVPEQIDGRDALYVDRSVICRAAETFGRGR